MGDGAGIWPLRRNEKSQVVEHPCDGQMVKFDVGFPFALVEMCASTV